MRQGMDRGNRGTDRRGTSRTSKPDTSRRAVPAAGARPATGRMNVQGSGTSRADASQQRGQGQAPPPGDNKTMLYVGIGGGALVFALILALTMGGGESGGSGGGGVGADKLVHRAINEATLAYQRGEYRTGLDICEQALSDPKSRKASSYNALQALANQLRTQVNLDRDAQIKVGDFR